MHPYPQTHWILTGPARLLPSTLWSFLLLSSCSVMLPFLSFSHLTDHQMTTRGSTLGAGRVWGRWALREDRDATHGYLVGVVLVDDADVLAVREPEEAEVLGFLQMAVQVVKNLTSAEERRKDCVGHSGMVGSPRSQVPECALVSPQQRETLKIALTLPNGMGCLTI